MCLTFRPGPPDVMEKRADGAMVADLNLMSYASAELAYFGSTQCVVQEVRACARRSRHMLDRYLPRKPHMLFFERMEGAAAPPAHPHAGADSPGYARVAYGDPVSAARLAEQGISVAGGAGDRWNVARALQVLAWAAGAGGTAGARRGPARGRSRCSTRCRP